VTQFKLEEMEGGGGEQTVEQRQQKLTGMIAEAHIDKVRQEYQQQKQQVEEQEQFRVQLAKQISAPAAPVKQPSLIPVKPVTGVVKPTSAGFSYPKAPSEDLSNGSHSVSSPVHHPRVLPAVPIKQSSGVGYGGHGASPPVQAHVLSTSLPAVTSSHFMPSQPPPLQSFPWFHGDISRDIAVKRLEEYSMTDG